jgi:hypothetical protein
MVGRLSGDCSWSLSDFFTKTSGYPENHNIDPCSCFLQIAQEDFDARRLPGGVGPDAVRVAQEEQLVALRCPFDEELLGRDLRTKIFRSFVSF